MKILKILMQKCTHRLSKEVFLQNNYATKAMKSIFCGLTLLIASCTPSWVLVDDFEIVEPDNARFMVEVKGVDVEVKLADYVESPDLPDNVKDLNFVDEYLKKNLKTIRLPWKSNYDLLHHEVFHLYIVRVYGKGSVYITFYHNGKAFRESTLDSNNQEISIAYSPKQDAIIF